MTTKAKVSKKDNQAAVYVSPGDLLPWPGNPRINDGAVDDVVRSIERFGFGAPIVARAENRQIIAGHTRLKAALRMGLVRVPVRFIDISEDEAHLLAVADNKTAEIAEWDHDALASFIAEMDSAGVDLDGLGFSADELAGLIDDANPAPPEPPPEPEAPPEDPITKPGDLLVLGRHRLLCGDSTKAEDVERLLAGDKPALMVADPPYGVRYDESWRGVGKNDFGGLTAGTMEGDNTPSWKDAYALAPADVAYVWHASAHAHVVLAELIGVGFEIRQQIIWRKPFGVLSRSAYNWQHEPCWYAVRRGKTARWVGGHDETTVWDATIPNHPMARDDDTRTRHQTQKPLEVMARPIRNHEGDVYEPFCGSGTTLIACEMEGRLCYAMEISPAYCDVIVKRWEQYTGEKAERVEA